MQNIAAVRIQNSQLDDRSERTGTVLATISLRLKTKTKQALESLSLQNLRIVNSDGQLVPVEIDSRIQLQVKEELTTTIWRIAVQCIKDTQEVFGFRCPLDGEYKIGGNWADTH